jgi:quercetin dioxygenase-like cupin family protein
MKRLLLTVLLFAVTGAVGLSQTPQTPIGISRTTVIDNPRVIVMRLVMDPGAREQVHSHPYDVVVVQLTRGTVETTIGTDRTTSLREPGFVWFIAKNTPHAAANVGKEPFEVVTTILKEGK